MCRARGAPLSEDPRRAWQSPAVPASHQGTDQRSDVFEATSPELHGLADVDSSSGSSVMGGGAAASTALAAVPSALSQTGVASADVELQYAPGKSLGEDSYLSMGSSVGEEDSAADVSSAEMAPADGEVQRVTLNTQRLEYMLAANRNDDSKDPFLNAW